MSSHPKYAAILCWIAALFIGGTLLFLQGFLLKRVVIEESSVCNVNLSTAGMLPGEEHEQNFTGCWMQKGYSKAIVIIIDALRFDFVSPSTQDEIVENYYTNKLSYMQEQILQRPQNARLFRFRADPPTTTMQRLKGLTTGSLPTFVDAGANFASYEITEDNIIDQLKSNGKSITFMGDDTWLGLFPDRFNKSYPFPSFNVKDLHTVDNGVIEHLMPEIHSNDWDLLIAHFLGVDHCGHRYGPNHPAMSEKLQQMDDVVKEITEEMDTETILFVFGDHGMTKTGDHGGDSLDELDAALFVYSKRNLTSSKTVSKDKYRTVSQVDFVPTLSLLLGVPIPFSNLGSVIPELFNIEFSPEATKNVSKSQSMANVVRAMRLNAHQMREYLRSYLKISRDFPGVEYAELDLTFHHAESRLQAVQTTVQMDGTEKDLLQKIRMTRQAYASYLEGAKKMCHDVWAKFDDPSIILGSVMQITGVVLSCQILFAMAAKKDGETKISSAVIGSMWMVLLVWYLYSVGLNPSGLVASLTLGFPAILISTHVVTKLIENKKSQAENQVTEEKVQYKSEWNFIDSFAIAFIIMLCIGMFSNSFVVYEDSVTLFLLISTVLILFYKTLQAVNQRFAKYKVRGQRIPSFDIGLVLTSPQALLLYATVGLLMCIRLSTYFRACREEQWNCESSYFSLSISALPEQAQAFKNSRYLLSAASICFIVYALRNWLRYYGNLNGSSLMVMQATYSLPCMVICLLFYWAMQSLPSHVIDSLPSWQVTLFPRNIYIIFISILLTIIFKPLTMYIVDREDSHGMYIHPSSDIIPQVFKRIKSQFNNQRAPKAPLVYGLGTAYTSCFLILLVGLSLLLIMLLGDGMAPVVLLYLLAMFLVLEIHATYIRVKSNGCITSVSIPWFTSAVWFLLTSNFFFATGHQATIPAIPFNAAYHGFSGDFDVYAIPAALITMNTFAIQLLSVVSLPLLLFWPTIRGDTIFTFNKTKGNPIKDKGELEIKEKPQVLRTALAQIFVSHLLCQGLKLFASVIAAAVLRRHLMAWKIFAPRMVYESAATALVSVFSIIVYVLVLHLDHEVDRWIDNIGDKYS